MHKRWRALIYRVISKQQAKREQTHPMCLSAVANDEKVGRFDAQNDYETTSKN